MVKKAMAAIDESRQGLSPVHTEVLGSSDIFLQFQEQLSRVARVDRPVLIIGERGTGKELAASRLHFLSQRWEGALVTLNSAALPENLVESELFGHEAGAFTGAAARRRGRFELASGGTLFLDEIASMPLPVQEKILRAVEYGVFERVGGSTTVRADVRIVAAANADLPKLAEAGRFRRDLLDRLAFEVLNVPPLRERGEDILLLARHFASGMASELDMPDTPMFSAEAEDALLGYSWPGNVRELKNVVERAVYRAGGGEIDRLDFDPFASPWRLAGEPAEPAPETAVRNDDAVSEIGAESPAQGDGRLLHAPLPQAVADLEVRWLREALERARHNQRKAASLLGLSYHQFRGLFRKHRVRVLAEADGE